MSETITEDRAAGEEVTTDDLKRMLDESRNLATTRERERDEERQTRQRVERERDEVTTHVKSAAELRYAAELQATESATAAAKSAAEQAKAAYKAAMEAGDFQAAADAQEAIADAATARREATTRKTWLDTNKDQLTRGPTPTTREAPRPTGKYAQYVGDLRDSEAQWLDSRPQFLDDGKYRSKVFGASQIAGTEFERGTQDYFRRMEELLGEGTKAPPREQRQERSASADLPASGSRVPGAERQGGREINLTADQAEIADGLYGNPSSDSYIADKGERYKRYAGNLQRMKESGRL